MKKLFTLLLCILLSGCKTTPFYINQAMKAKERNFSEKLPNLEAVYEDENALKNFSINDSFVKVNTPEATKFYREVEKNLIDISGEKRGYIVLTPILSAINEEEILESQDLGALLGISTLGLVPLIFNIPKIPFKGYSEIEVRILDNNGKIIKRYSTEQTSFIKHSVWNQCLNCVTRAKWEAYEAALENIFEQIYQDRIWLTKKLNNSL